VEALPEEFGVLVQEIAFIPAVQVPGLPL
jgi:hypothetical protein